ncbi:MAG: clan AA aspartic protease [Chloroflexi bacterium]|nr:clan AA aspartic protease [Chloroflexota bacterium]
MDTGFTGDLTLPVSAIRRLGLPRLGERVFTLADGRRDSMNAYSGTLLWHERPLDVIVIQSDGVPLIGMGTLWGSQIILNAVDDGSVTIEEITSA